MDNVLLTGTTAMALEMKSSSLKLNLYLEVLYYAGYEKGVYHKISPSICSTKHKKEEHKWTYNNENRMCCSSLIIQQKNKQRRGNCSSCCLIHKKANFTS